MLAKETDAPFTDNDWLFEIKWDGYRAIAEVKGDAVQLYSRNGNSFINSYPPISEALAQLDIDAVLDGEIVAQNDAGNPDFQRLQHYADSDGYPLVYYVFDLLEMNGQKLYDQPLSARKELLQQLLPENALIKYSDHVETAGEDFFAAIKEQDLEGMMAKRKGSLYYPGKRSADWLKVKLHKTDEAIIAGYTRPRGGRKYFGALVLATYVNDMLTYIGHTGSGFDGETIREVYQQLQPLVTSTSPFHEKVKTNMPVTWVQPQLVCELKFSEWTSDRKMRHPIFLRIRTDKQPNDLKQTKQGNMAKAKPTSAAATKKPKAPTANPAQEAKTAKADEHVYKAGKVNVKTTNRSKIFFPESGITKGDVLDYYEQMAPLILPYLKDRPESLYRTPNGINQKGFFQKDAGQDAPEWVKHTPLFSESNNANIDYILCNNAATLLYMANLGCVEINPWHSVVATQDQPDYLIIDIDPSDNNTFEQVIEAAQAVQQVLDKAGAFSIPKTSGASGLHIYVPLGRKYDYEQAKNFAQVVCLMASQMLPNITTLERNLQKRGKNRIYMDYLQNRRGQTIACAYSLRPKPGATVSTPLLWEEVKSGLSPTQFDIHTIHDRVASIGDLFAPILDKKKAIDMERCISSLEG